MVSPEIILCISPYDHGQGIVKVTHSDIILFLCKHILISIGQCLCDDLRSPQTPLPYSRYLIMGLGVFATVESPILW